MRSSISEGQEVPIIHTLLFTPGHELRLALDNLEDLVLPPPRVQGTLLHQGGCLIRVGLAFNELGADDEELGGDHAVLPRLHLR
jgi:hypothetical protein